MGNPYNFGYGLSVMGAAAARGLRERGEIAKEDERRALENERIKKENTLRDQENELRGIQLGEARKRSEEQAKEGAASDYALEKEGEYVGDQWQKAYESPESQYGPVKPTIEDDPFSVQTRLARARVDHFKQTGDGKAYAKAVHELRQHEDNRDRQYITDARQSFMLRDFPKTMELMNKAGGNIVKMEPTPDGGMIIQHGGGPQINLNQQEAMKAMTGDPKLIVESFRAEQLDARERTRQEHQLRLQEMRDKSSVIRTQITAAATTRSAQIGQDKAIAIHPVASMAQGLIAGGMDPVTAYQTSSIALNPGLSPVEAAAAIVNKMFDPDTTPASEFNAQVTDWEESIKKSREEYRIKLPNGGGKEPPKAADRPTELTRETAKGVSFVNVGKNPRRPGAGWSEKHKGWYAPDPTKTGTLKLVE